MECFDGCHKDSITLGNSSHIKLKCCYKFRTR